MPTFLEDVVKHAVWNDNAYSGGEVCDLSSADFFPPELGQPGCSGFDIVVCIVVVPASFPPFSFLQHRSHGCGHRRSARGEPGQLFVDAAAWPSLGGGGGDGFGGDVVSFTAESLVHSPAGAVVRRAGLAVDFVRTVVACLCGRGWR